MTPGHMRFPRTTSAPIHEVAASEDGKVVVFAARDLHRLPGCVDVSAGLFPLVQLVLKVGDPHAQHHPHGQDLVRGHAQRRDLLNCLALKREKKRQKGRDVHYA